MVRELREGENTRLKDVIGLKEDEARVGDAFMGSVRLLEAIKVLCGRRAAQEQIRPTRTWAGDGARRRERTIMGERQGGCGWQKGIRGLAGDV